LALAAISLEKLRAVRFGEFEESVGLHEQKVDSASRPEPNQDLGKSAVDFMTDERNPATSKAIWRTPFRERCKPSNVALEPPSTSTK